MSMEKIVLEMFEAEYGRPWRDTEELMQFVFDLRERNGWKMLHEIIQTAPAARNR
jgi:hypothetical protein